MYMHHSAVVCCINGGFYPFFNPQSNTFIKNNFFFKPSVTLYKFSLKFLDSIIFQSRHLFFFLLTFFFLSKTVAPDRIDTACFGWLQILPTLLEEKDLILTIKLLSYPVVPVVEMYL